MYEVFHSELEQAAVIRRWLPYTVTIDRFDCTSVYLTCRFSFHQVKHVRVHSWSELTLYQKIHLTELTKLLTSRQIWWLDIEQP